MSFWGNLVGYQLVWLLAVGGAARGSAWPGVAGAAVFVAWQSLASGQPAVEWRLAMLAMACGLAVDGVMAACGWARYAAAEPALPPGSPLWIEALWAAFAMTLNRSLAIAKRHALAATALGALGAPLAYYAASSHWQAVEFAAPAWRGWLWLAAGWALALPLLAGCARRWSYPRQVSVS